MEVDSGVALANALQRHVEAVEMKEDVSQASSLFTAKGAVVYGGVPTKMVYAGFRGSSKTVHGVDKSVAISALQKYVRRGEDQKAMWMAQELLHFDQAEGTKAILTNLMNRLAIIAMEDVSETEWPTVLFVLENLNSWAAKREKSSPPSNGDENLLMAVCAMAHRSVKKNRFGSHVRCAWTVGNLPQVKAKMPKELLEPMEAIRKAAAEEQGNSSPLEYLLRRIKEMTKQPVAEMKDGPEKAWRQGTVSVSHYDVLYSAALAVMQDAAPVGNTDKLAILRGLPAFRRKKIFRPVHLVWNALVEYARAVGYGSPMWSLMALLAEWYQHECKEQFLFLFRALRLVQLGERVGQDINNRRKWCQQTVKKIPSRAEHAGGPAVEVEPYCIDMHTNAKGVDRGAAGQKQFAMEGAKVVNQDERVHAKLYHNIYDWIKCNQELIGSGPVSQGNNSKKPAAKRKAQDGADVASSSSSASVASVASFKQPAAKRQKQEAMSTESFLSQAEVKAAFYDPTAAEWEEWRELFEKPEQQVHAQRITSGWKQHVIMTPKYVWKGPYETSGKPNVRRRLVAMLQRWNLFKEIGFDMPEVRLVRVRGDDWVRYDAIHRAELAAEWKMEPKRTGDKPGEKADTYSVLDRTTTGVVQAIDTKIKELLEAGNDDVMCGKIVLAQVVKYVMDPACGDAGPWNTLVELGSKRVVPIDLEENRVKLPEITKETVAEEEKGVSWPVVGDEDTRWAMRRLLEVVHPRDVRMGGLWCDMGSLWSWVHGLSCAESREMWKRVKEVSLAHPGAFSVDRIAQVDRLLMHFLG